MFVQVYVDSTLTSRREASRYLDPAMQLLFGLANKEQATVVL